MDSATPGSTEPPWPADPCDRLTIPNRLCGASGFVAILPYVEQTALLKTLDARQGGLWVDNLNDRDWYDLATAAKREAMLIRPEVYVCPSAITNTQSDVYEPVTIAATGCYALCNGTLGPDSEDNLVKYENDGPFVYARKRRVASITDGMSNTYFVGEGTFGHLWESSNVWTYGRIHADTLRSTRNPPNTPPGEGIVQMQRNGAFSSDHPGGVQFAFGDGHVEFISDDIAPRVYNAAASIAGGL